MLVVAVEQLLIIKELKLLVLVGLAVAVLAV
jgi:hypothetical protein